VRAFANTDIHLNAAQIASFGILVVGSGPLYTRQFCAHMESEFDVGCLRVDSVAQVAHHGDRLSDLRLLIVDQRLGEDLLARPEAYRSVNPDAVIALAYRKVEVARAFYEQCAVDRHGRIGYLPMSAPFEVMLSAIRLLLHKEYYLPSGFIGAVPESPEMQEARAGRPARNAPCETPAARLALLTDREREVLKRVSEGQSNKEIAQILGISDHTVKLHMHNISRKLDVPNRTAAASLYLARGRGSDGSAT
jgi:DNA-binding CsgD family transcriptional regulator